ncbi:hypothetical protein LY01_01407 [Nonlabens xylanidelens]|uniref:Uncharacterized protein n=1 Tax=Nonlabens xylanidelens TaxID=191564 RepID=A0A2S6INI6_9FLAO|nr:hypothetical protein LY01_01407 [Nonlabens xylanidelens]
MKNWNISLSICIFIFISCTNTISTKKLNLKTVENEEIKIEHYTVSEFSNSYTHIDLTNKRWNKTELILRANSEVIDSVYIKQDSIIIMSKYENSKSLIYDLTAIKYGYNILLKIKEDM